MRTLGTFADSNAVIGQNDDGNYVVQVTVPGSNEGAGCVITLPAVVGLDKINDRQAYDHLAQLLGPHLLLMTTIIMFEVKHCQMATNCDELTQVIDETGEDLTAIIKRLAPS